MPQRHFSRRRPAPKLASKLGPFADAFTPTERPMSNGISQVCSAALLAFAMMMSQASQSGAEGLKPVAVSASGVIAQRSAYDVDQTVERLKKDIAAKGIVFFQEIDQQALAGKAGIELRPSVLLTFGNPPL